jgi:hypothetical protein
MFERLSPTRILTDCQVSPEPPKSTTMFRVVYLPVNQCYALVFGSCIGDASILKLGTRWECHEYLRDISA